MEDLVAVLLALGGVALLCLLGIAAIIGAPPVYDPGGLTCMIDDFCVADPVGWATVGRALLAEAGQQARARGQPAGCGLWPPG